jgi:hypothetical protein
MTCHTVWDSDTGEVTITAMKDGLPVDLSATTSREVIVKNVTTGVVTTLPATSEDLPNGEITVSVESLPRGRYDLVLRVEDASGQQTYPNACYGPVELSVRRDLDAV